MSSILNDLRYGLRMIRKQPGSSGIAILALALGIGLTAMMFSIVYGAMLRGLPFEKADQLLTLSTTRPAEHQTGMTPTIHDFTEWRRQQKSFEDLAASYNNPVNLSEGARPERHDAAYVTPEVFTLLRVKPIKGRLITAADNVVGAPDVMLISYEIWKNRFGSDPAVVGKVQRANGKPTTIIGVMPAKFGFPQNESLWFPMRQDPARVEWGKGNHVDVFGRIRDNVGIDAANAELNRLAQQLAVTHPESNKGTGVEVRPYIESSFGPEPIAMLYTMLGAVFLVLLIACTNVANLLISRAATRSKEVGVRTALGASRARIIRQFLAESLIISFVGAAFGTAIAWAGSRMFMNAIADTEPPFWIDVKVDTGVMLFVLGVTILATMLAGAFPAFSAASTSVNEVLKDEARGSSSLKLGKLSRALVVFEIALSAGLLVGAGLIIRSITNLSTVDYGFETRTVYTGRIGLTDHDYPTEASRALVFDELIERVRALPGVEAAAIATGLPGRGSGGSQFAVEGATYPNRQYPNAGNTQVSPDFFKTLGIPIVAGRSFTPADKSGAVRVAIVTESLVRKHLGNKSALGRRIQMNPRPTDKPEYLTIVGVIPDSYLNGLTQEDQSAVITPVAQRTGYSMSVVARVAGRPMEIASGVRSALAAIDPDQPMWSEMTLQESIDANNWFYRVFGSLFMSFGIAALFLASVGLYGVMATSVSHRTREMGVRMALGANTRDVLRLIMREGMLQLAIGLTLGLVFALFVSKLLAMLLFQVAPRDPVTFITIGVVLVITATAATLIPALRAARVTPVEAMYR